MPPRPRIALKRRRAKQCRRCAGSPPPDYRHSRATECARLRVVTKRRGSWRSHVHRTYIAQRVQPFKPKACNASLSLGDKKGVFSFAKENTPFAWQWRSAPHDQCSAARCNPRPLAGGNKKRALSRIERRSLLLVASVNLTDTSACRRWRGRGRRRRRS